MSSTAPETFSITSRGDGATTVITLTGDLDLAAEMQLTAASAQLLTARDEVVIDLRDVVFMDVRGLKGLVRLRTLCELGDRRLSIIRGPRVVQRLFALCGLEDGFEFIASP